MTSLGEEARSLGNNFRRNDLPLSYHIVALSYYSSNLHVRIVTLTTTLKAIASNAEFRMTTSERVFFNVLRARWYPLQ